MMVVDASAVLELLLHSSNAQTVAKRLFALEETLYAPHLIDLEVAQVLRRYWLAGELEPERGGEALALLRNFPLMRYPHEPLLPRIWQLRRNLTAYDAAYVALAEVLSVPLVTRDRALAASVGHRARVELV